MPNKTIRCYNCKAVILSLPKDEVAKLNGLNFTCECCGHNNLLTGFKFHEGAISDPSINTFSFDTLDKAIAIALSDPQSRMSFN